VSIIAVGLRRPTLDDVFLTLTGRVAEPGDDAPSADRPEEVRS
jgi:ABC-2 type transport system ATP-binding protein